MLLRSGRNLDSQLDFNTCSLQQFAFIQSGGLRFRSQFQQVSKESYSSLAKLNALGFLTVDSVDHHYAVKDKLGIHCIVTGFVRSETLIQLQAILHQETSHVGMVHHILIEQYDDEYNQRIQLPVNYYKKEGHEINQSYIRLYYTHESIEFLKKQLHLNSKELVEFVTFVDMQNNTNPNQDNGMFLQLIHAFSLCEGM